DYMAYGVAFFNIPGIMYWDRYKPDQLPVRMRGGLSFTPVPIFSFLTEYDKRFYRNGLSQPGQIHLGMELTLATWLQLRGGTYGEDLSDSEKTAYSAGFSVASSQKHQLDFALRTYRLAGERVYNYFVSIIFPLPRSSTEGRYVTSDSNRRASLRPEPLEERF
ncbi:MAG TPA: hypothetical protein P5079_11610, partial [Elusimicrobiota bacterium]|nr:hypothetical protein [Elusimicrobiota bacterium]